MESEKGTCRLLASTLEDIYFNLSRCNYPGHPKLEQIEAICCNFPMPLNLLKRSLKTVEIRLFHEKAILWLNNFSLVNMTSNVTPYMHVLI